MDYELLDTGGEEKLERYGGVIVRRPDPQALWERSLPSEKWEAADATFLRRGEKGGWTFGKQLPSAWPIEFGGLTFEIRLTSFKHTGIFPEQLANWEWVAPHAKGATVLNLFGYTGGASLAAAKAGASVTHIDASKSAVEWARKNAELSNLSSAPIRWIVEDTMKFVDRDLKRGAKYDGIILDPPSFGHGPDGELWKIEEDLVPLMQKCRELLSDKPRFVVMNGYAAGYSHLAFEHLLGPVQKFHGGSVEGGELTLQETGPLMRLLPCGIYARWSSSTP